MLKRVVPSPSIIALWHPRHWPIRFSLTLLRMLVLLPYPALLFLGQGLGVLLFVAGKRRRHIAAVNIKLCFPNLDKHQHKRLLYRHFISLGISIIETGLAWWAPDRKLNALVDIKGAINVQQALMNNQGVILLTGHFTTLEIGARIMALSLPFRCNALYRKHKNPIVEVAQYHGRNNRIGNPIAREDMRQMVKRLKNNEVIWFAPDQNYGHKNSVFANFFNVPAATNTATARLARITGAAVIPFFLCRDKDGRGYNVEFFPKVEQFPSGNITEDTMRINEIIEQHVKKIPEQYLWVHRRFKDRPPGEPGVY